jgi:hypothetical protein
MGRYKVLSSAKAGPGNFIQEGWIVDVNGTVIKPGQYGDMEEFKNLMVFPEGKLQELAAEGLLEAYDGKDKIKAKEADETVLDANLSPLDTPVGEDKSPPSSSEAEEGADSGDKKSGKGHGKK